MTVPTYKCDCGDTYRDAGCFAEHWQECKEQASTGNSELIAAIADLYQKHEDDFGGTNQQDIDGQDGFVDGMEELMPRVCIVIGHQPLLPDQCLKPEHDFCPRCRTQRMAIDA